MTNLDNFNRLCSLDQFPPIPDGDAIPLCETEGHIRYCLPEYSNLHIYTNVVANHPNVVITGDMLHHSAAHANINHVFLPVTETVWRRLQNAWYENGFKEALQIAASSREDDDFSLLRFLAQQTLIVINSFNRIRSRIPLLSTKEIEIKQPQGVSECIRCLEWHPHCTKLALATRDDCVRIFSSHTKLVPLLKCKAQRNVTSLAWRPLSASDLAVGCEAGVLVWIVDPNSVVMRPSPSTATLLQRKDHTHISSIAWSPEGDLLVSASKLDRAMYVWEVSTERAVPLKRVGGGGISLVSWAPDNLKVFAATNRIVFRVWNTDYWVPELWSVPSGHVVAACWSPCSSALLFATSTEPVIYSLTFGSIATVFTSEDRRKASRIVDLTPITLDTRDRVGGEVYQMVWDGRGRHLAVSFHNSDVIAVFLTNISSVVHISPCCFIKGQPGENPSVISFQKNFEEGSNLTIAWSSHRIQYFPFVYQELNTSNSLGATTFCSLPLDSTHLGKSFNATSRFPSFASP